MQGVPGVHEVGAVSFVDVAEEAGGDAFNVANLLLAELVAEPLDPLPGMGPPPRLAGTAERRSRRTAQFRIRGQRRPRTGRAQRSAALRPRRRLVSPSSGRTVRRDRRRGSHGLHSLPHRAANQGDLATFPRLPSWQALPPAGGRGLIASPPCRRPSSRCCGPTAQRFGQPSRPLAVSTGKSRR